MKKFMSKAIAVLGIIAVAAMVYLIVHYGEVNMRRRNESYMHWRSTREFR